MPSSSQLPLCSLCFWISRLCRCACSPEAQFHTLRAGVNTLAQIQQQHKLTGCITQRRQDRHRHSLARSETTTSLTAPSWSLGRCFAGPITLSLKFINITAATTAHGIYHFHLSGRACVRRLSLSRNDPSLILSHIRFCQSALQNILRGGSGPSNRPSLSFGPACLPTRLKENRHKETGHKQVPRYAQ